MFILDDILLSPAKAFMWIVRELHNAAQQDIQGEEDRLTHRLSTLYMVLETGGITPEEFDVQEQEILARLDAIQAARAVEEEIDEDGDEDASEEDEIDEDSESDVDSESDEDGEEDADDSVVQGDERRNGEAST